MTPLQQLLALTGNTIQSIDIDGDSDCQVNILFTDGQILQCSYSSYEGITMINGEEIKELE